MTETITCPVCGCTYEPDYPSEAEAPRGTIGWTQQRRGICSEPCQIVAGAQEAYQ